MMSACSSILSQSRHCWWYHRRCYHFASITASLRGSVTIQHHEEYDNCKRNKKYNTAMNVQRRRDISTNNKPVLNNVLSKEAATAPIDYPTSQRFLALPPAIGIHLAIGSVYVYSMWTPGMSKALGVVAAAP
eukprot:scaffold8939_cov118-Skeletonema_marinoi.AAC.1